MGVSDGLHPLIPVSDNKSKIYFRCDTTIPLFERATSIPRKYRRSPRSLISNSLARFRFSQFISSTSSTVKIISST
ncbi:hypothetical protein LguiB_012652 [Lonicera macranthoides]